MRSKIILALGLVELVGIALWAAHPLLTPPPGLADGHDAHQIMSRFPYSSRLVDPYEYEGDGAGNIIQMNVKRWVFMETKERAFAAVGSLVLCILVATLAVLLRRKMSQLPVLAGNLLVLLVLLLPLFLVVMSSFIKARHVTAHNYAIDDLRQLDSRKEKE